MRLEILCVAIFALLTGMAFGANAREFRVAEIQNDGFPTVKAVQYMGKVIDEQSKGRLKIGLFHSGLLGDEGQTLKQTREGAIDISRVNAFEIGAPLLDILSLPYLFRSEKHLHEVTDGPIGHEIAMSLYSQGLVALTYYDAGVRSIYTAKKIVRSLADLKGLRLRVQRSELMTKMAVALGAEPITLQYQRIPVAFATRIIDGAENNWSSFMLSGHFKEATYYTLTEHSRAPSVMVMSLRVWNELSTSDQTIIRQAAIKSATYMRSTLRQSEAQSRREAKNAGIKIIDDLDLRPFKKATESRRDQARFDPTVGSLVERIEKLN